MAWAKIESGGKINVVYLSEPNYLKITCLGNCCILIVFNPVNASIHVAKCIWK